MVEAGGALEVLLGGVSRDDEPRVEAEAREEHLHLLGRRVLRLVEDDEGVVHRAPAHEGERGDLDDALLDEGVAALHVGHVEERVIERAYVGVELLLQRAGKKPERLPRLDDGARQHDASDLLALQGGDGHRHGEVGLAGARRADSEGDGVLAYRVDVALLAGGLGPDGAPAEGEQDVVRQHLHARGAVAHAVDEQVDVVGREPVARLDEADHAREDRGGELDLSRVAGEADVVAAHGHHGVECPLDAAKQRVGGPHELGRVYGVWDGQTNVGGFHAPPEVFVLAGPCPRYMGSLTRTGRLSTPGCTTPSYAQ